MIFYPIYKHHLSWAISDGNFHWTATFAYRNIQLNLNPCSEHRHRHYAITVTWQKLQDESQNGDKFNQQKLKFCQTTWQPWYTHHLLGNLLIIYTCIFMFKLQLAYSHYWFLRCFKLSELTSTCSNNHELSLLQIGDTVLAIPPTPIATPVNGPYNHVININIIS